MNGCEYDEKVDDGGRVGVARVAARRGRRRNVDDPAAGRRSVGEDACQGAAARTARDLRREPPVAERRRGGDRRRRGHGKHDLRRGADDYQSPCGLQRHLRALHARGQLPRDGILGAEPRRGAARRGKDRVVPAQGDRRDGRGAGADRRDEGRRAVDRDVDAKAFRRPRTAPRRRHALRGQLRLAVERPALPDLFLRSLPRRAARRGAPRLYRSLRRHDRQLGVASAQRRFRPLSGLCRPRGPAGRQFAGVRTLTIRRSPSRRSVR